MALFRNRADAGRQLAKHLERYSLDPNAIVLGLPRGGVPVAYEIAVALKLPLDVYIVRKLGVPWHEELAMGAVAADGSCVVDQGIIESAGIGVAEFRQTLERELAELRRRESLYRDDRPHPDLERKNVIVVDDGLATGASMFSAISALRRRNPAQIVVAVPVAPADTVRRLEQSADRVVCPHQPPYFGAVGLYYQNFTQTTDGDVRRLLADAEHQRILWKVA
jgi:putative phosphoribosyl transferase